MKTKKVNKRFKERKRLDENANKDIEETNHRQEGGWVDDVETKEDVVARLAWHIKVMWCVYVT